MSTFIAFATIITVLAFFAAIIVVPLIIIYKSVTKSQVNAQIDLWKAEEELAAKKTLSWKCTSCGASNYNREKCEYCGTAKPNKTNY